MSKGNTGNNKSPGQNAIDNCHNNNSGGGGGTVSSFNNTATFQVEGRSLGLGSINSHSYKPKAGGQVITGILQPSTSALSVGKRQQATPNSAILQAKPPLLSNTGQPPRYQPPPQPPGVSGILKQQQPHLGQREESADSIIQRSEVDEIYLASGKSNNPVSRIVPPKFQTREGRDGQVEQQGSRDGGHRSDVQVQIHPPPRIPTTKSVPFAASQGNSVKSVEEEFNFLQRQDMLKFVRKSDSGQPSPSSSGGGGSGRMMTGDQNRHIQVRDLCFVFKNSLC